MKILAYIMVVGIGMLGMNRFAIVNHFNLAETEQSCGLESAGGACDGASGDEAESPRAGDKEEGDLAHTCPNDCNCDCSCCYHIMAITYQFLSVPETTKQSHDYGIYINKYHFEFYIPLFEPPRNG